MSALCFSYSDLEEYLLSDGTSATFYGYEVTRCLSGGSCDTEQFTNRQVWAGPVARICSERSLRPLGSFLGAGGADPDFSGIYGPYTPTACDGYQYQERNQSDTSLEIRLASDEPMLTVSWIAGAYARRD